MWIYVCGDNERTYFLRELCAHRGHRVTCPNDAEVVVLPLPNSQVSDALREKLHRGQTLVCGLTDETLEREAKERGWRLWHIYQDEKYQEANSWDSAEGAAYALMQKAPFAIRDCRCLIIGYGRLGKALRKLLMALGAQVTVTARNPAQREAAGETSLDIAQAMERLGDYDVIVNTVPAQIMGKTALQRVQRDALLMDTASSPYGFNLEEALSMRLHAWRENGIPGRYCPQTAALRLMDCIERGCEM